MNFEIELLVGGPELLLHINPLALIGCVLLASLGQLLVVVGRRFKSSVELVKDERRRLKQSGWKAVAPDDGQQRAAESPGQKLRITYATALADLEGIDLGWIKRPRTITLGLARAMFDQAPAMSVLLEAGPACFHTWR